MDRTNWVRAPQTRNATGRATSLSMGDALGGTAGEGFRQVNAERILARRVREYANGGATACAETAQLVLRKVAERYPVGARSAP